MHNTTWTAAELRLTREQIDCLRTGTAVHPSQRTADRTELILKRRGMLGWLRQPDGSFRQEATEKGRAALARRSRGGTAR